MTEQLPVGSPLLGPSISGTRYTVDTLTKPVTRIAPIIRDLVAENEGYFAEQIFATPGFTVDGGALIYTETFPQDLFLDPDKSFGPRAPGSEAPELGAFRQVDSIARPESISGQFEVHDEQRRRNNVTAVANMQRKVANTFADRMQTRALATLNEALDTWDDADIDVVVTGVSWADAATASGGTVNVARTTQPQRDFAQVLAAFIADKAGVRPDTAILNQDDAVNLDMIYPGDLLTSLLARYGIKNLLVSPQQTVGEALFLKSKQVGVIAFEKPLDTEYVREGKRKTDVYVVEATPVFVAVDASAVKRLTGIAA